MIWTEEKSLQSILPGSISAESWDNQGIEPVRRRFGCPEQEYLIPGDAVASGVPV